MKQPEPKRPKFRRYPAWRFSRLAPLLLFPLILSEYIGIPVRIAIGEMFRWLSI